MLSSRSIHLSIIMPVYNKAEYVSRCLHSILDQDYTDYELIIVNDGSTDSSADIIRSFTDTRIKLLTTTNQGVSAARNRGMAEAKGEYLMFIDADDYISPHYLGHIMQQAEANKADLYVWGITKDFTDGRQVPKVPKTQGLLKSADFLHEMVEEQYRRHMGIMGYISNKLIRHDIVKNHHIRFDTSKKLMEDYDFFLSYYAYVRTAYFFDESGYHYVEHPPVSGAHKVDYLSLIDTHHHCLLLTPNSAEADLDNRTVLQAIGKLTLAMFLELKPVTFAHVGQLLSSIDQHSFCKDGLRMIHPKQRRLRQWLLTGSRFCTYAYLKYRHLYFTFREKVSLS